jgi:hypothetical protein
VELKIELQHYVIETFASNLHQQKMSNTNPTIFKRLWRAWIRFGHWLGNIMSWVWMPLFYFTFTVPFALVVKFFADPLRMRIPPQKSYWVSKKLPKLDVAWAKNQGSITVEERSK